MTHRFGDKSHMTTDDFAKGKPAFFHLNQYINVVYQMCSCDEVLTALYMLDHLPGYYREFPTEEIKQARKFIKSKLYLPIQYSQNPHEKYDDAVKWENDNNPNIKTLEEKIDIPFCQPRAQIIIDVVKEYNANCETPHIVELGPYDYWLPLGLKAKGAEFTYRGLTLNQAAEVDIKSHLADEMVEPDKDAPLIYVCCEVLEHLFDEQDVRRYCDKLDKEPDRVIISTPRNSFFGGKSNWTEYDIEHIRTYTPQEFIALAQKFWPNYSWELFLAPSQVLLGKRL